jgi:uncharacterized protein (DUF697 family)
MGEPATGQDAIADQIVNRHVAYSMVGGAVPVPVVDLAAVTAVQLDMLKQLAELYEVELDARSTRAFVTSLTTALAGNALGRVAASFAKLIPGVGSIAGGVASLVATGASTYAVGSVVQQLFSQGKSFDELDAAALEERAKAYYAAGLDRARAAATKMKQAGSRFRKRGG